MLLFQSINGLNCISEYSFKVKTSWNCSWKWPGDLASEGEQTLRAERSWRVDSEARGLAGDRLRGGSC